MKNIIQKCYTIIDKTVEIIIVVVFSLMVIVGGMQVFFRYVLHNSLSWSEEFQKFMHIWLIFLAIPLAYKKGAHIGMNVIFDKLPDKMKSILTVLIDVLWFGLGGIMVFYTTRIMKVAKLQTSPGLGLRMDLVYSCIIIGGVYLCLTALHKIYEHLSGTQSQIEGDVI
ncbi:TRAP transporter small permease [Candidatus Latescibacterota bacterium]